MKRISCVILILFFSANTSAQDKKILNIKRTENPPAIDGVLDDDAWKEAEIGNDFIQFRPDMGITERPHQKSQIRMTYNDDAVFFAAYLHDDPKEISQQFSTI